MENEKTRRIKEKAIAGFVKKADFLEKLVGMSHAFSPKYHQFSPIYEVIKNGVGRVLLAGATSSGKTLPIALTIALLNKKKRAKFLWMAPDQSIRTALMQDANKYLEDFDLPPVKIASITDSQKDKDEAHIISINYSKLGYRPYQSNGEYDESPPLDNNHFVRDILKLAPSIDGIVLDEVQNMKNPSAQRMENFKNFVNKTLDKYFILASASPCHNRLKDLGAIFYILDPKSSANPHGYPLEEYIYDANPFAIKDMILRGKWFTCTRADLKAIYPSLPALPEERTKELEVGIGNEYAQKYLELWADRAIGAGKKMMGMRKILLEGILDDKNTYLPEFLSNLKKNKTQVIMFSYLKTGIIEKEAKIASKVFGNDKVGYVDGSVPFDERVKLAEKFRQGKISCLIETIKTMGEGIPQQTYDLPVAEVLLEPPLNQGDYNQVLGRPYRVGQTGDVSVDILIAKSKELEEAQIRIKTDLDKSNIKSRANWRPGTITRDMNELRKAQERIYQKLMESQIKDGKTLTQVEQKTMNIAIDPTSIPHLGEDEISSLISLLPNAKGKENSLLKVVGSLNKLHGLGKENLKQAIEGKGEYASYYAQIEKNLGLVRYALASGIFVSKAVEEIEKNDGCLEQIVDLGCGPLANVARALNKPIINLDASKGMLDKTKKVCEKLGLDCKYVHAFMHDTPFYDGSQDLLISSNSLNFNPNSHENREVEAILIESNRILKDKGYFIVTFPSGRSVSENDFSQLAKLTKEYGFNPLTADMYEGVNKKGKVVFNGAYLLIAKKMASSTGYANDNKNLPQLFLPERYILTGGSKLWVGNGGMPRPIKTKSDEEEKATEQIIYRTKSGKKLEDIFK